MSEVLHKDRALVEVHLVQLAMVHEGAVELLEHGACLIFRRSNRTEEELVDVLCAHTPTYLELLGEFAPVAEHRLSLEAATCLLVVPIASYLLGTAAVLDAPSLWSILVPLAETVAALGASGYPHEEPILAAHALLHDAGARAEHTTPFHLTCNL